MDGATAWNGTEGSVSTLGEASLPLSRFDTRSLEGLHLHLDLDKF